MRSYLAQVTLDDLRIKPPVPRFKKPPPLPAEDETAHALKVIDMIDTIAPDGRSINPPLPPEARPKGAEEAPQKRRTLTVRRELLPGGGWHAGMVNPNIPDFTEWATENLWAMGGKRGKVMPPPGEFLQRPDYKQRNASLKVPLNPFGQPTFTSGSFQTERRSLQADDPRNPHGNPAPGGYRNPEEIAGMNLDEARKQTMLCRHQQKVTMRPAACCGIPRRTACRRRRLYLPAMPSPLPCRHALR